jgi:hypothetical protein
MIVGSIDACFLPTNKYTTPAKAPKNSLEIKAMFQMIFTFGRIVEKHQIPFVNLFDEFELEFNQISIIR